jgi:hypothetical protein
MRNELKRGIRLEVGYILYRAGQQVIQADYGMTLEQQTVAHVRADKPRSSGNDDSQRTSFMGFHQFS